MVTSSILTRKKPEDPKNEKNFLVILGMASELGFSIALPIAGGGLIGYFFDQALGTSPFLTLILLFAGVLMGLFNLYSLVAKTKEKSR